MKNLSRAAAHLVHPARRQARKGQKGGQGSEIFPGRRPRHKDPRMRARARQRALTPYPRIHKDGTPARSVLFDENPKHDRSIPFMPSRQTLKYRWLRLVGVSGSVMAMSPASNAGCI